MTEQNMPVRKNAFANQYERESFYKLFSAFGNDWRIYHNLPFLNVLEPNQNERQLLGLTNEEWDYLLKTSVDFVVYDGSDQPVACIEFDALRQGFCLDGKYESLISDERREWKMNLKIKIAEFFDFPFFIAGSDLFKNLSDQLKITFVDGVIGNILASSEFKKIIQSEAFKQAPAFNDESGLSKFEALEYDLKRRHNPIYRKWSEIIDRYYNESGATSHYTHYHFPSSSDFSEVTHVGVKCSVRIPSYGNSEAMVWMPRYSVRGDSLSSGHSDLPERMSFILAVENLLKRASSLS